MSGNWLDLSSTSNRYIQTYVRGFLDMSGGNLLLRNNNILVNDGDISLNGRLFVNGDAFMKGNLFVSDISFGKAKLTLNSDVSLNENVYINNLFVKNNISTDASCSTEIKGTVLLENTLNITGIINQSQQALSGGYIYLPPLITNEEYIDLVTLARGIKDVVSINNLSQLGNIAQLGIGGIPTQTLGDTWISGNLLVMDSSNINAQLNTTTITGGPGALYVAGNLANIPNGSLNVGKNIAVGQNLTITSGNVSINSGGITAYQNIITTNGGIVSANDILVNGIKIGRIANSNGKNIGIGANLLSNATQYTINNIAIGENTLNNLTDNGSTISGNYGSNNTAIGVNSGAGAISGINNTFIGGNTRTMSGSYNGSTAIGYGAIINGSNQIVLGTSSEILIQPGSVSIGSTLAPVCQLDVSGSGRFTYDVSINGNIFIGGEITVGKGKLTDINTEGFLYVGKDASFNSRIMVLSDVSIGGRLYVTGQSYHIGDSSFNGSVFINGDASMGGRMFLKGDAELNGDASMGGRMFLKGDAELNGVVAINGDASLNSRLIIGGDASMGGRMFLKGDAELNGVVAINGDASLNSRLIIGGDASMGGRMFLKGNAELNGVVAINGDASLNSRAIINGDVSMGGRLFVQGDTSLNGNLLVKGTLTVQQMTNKTIINTTTSSYQLIVSEDLSLNGRMFVSGDGSFNNRLIVATDVSLGGRLLVAGTSTLTGDVSLNTRLIVASDVSMGGRLFVKGTSVLNGDASFNNRILVTSDASIGGRLYLNGTSVLDGDASFNNRIIVATDVSVGGRLFVGGNVSMMNYITVTSGTVNYYSRSYSQIAATRYYFNGGGLSTSQTTGQHQPTLSVSSNGSYLIMGSYGNFSVSNNQAVTWTTIGSYVSDADTLTSFTSGGPKDGIYAISSAISSTGQYQTVLTRYDSAFSTYNSTTSVADAYFMYTSSDYGANWTRRDTKFWREVAMSSDGLYQTAIVGTYAPVFFIFPNNSNQTSNLGTIWTSSDYGVTWTERQTGTNRNWYSISMSSDGIYQTAVTNYGFGGVFGSEGYIYVSSDYGVTWTVKMNDTSRSWFSVAVSGTGQYQTAILGAGAGLSSGTVYRSEDYGANWAAVSPILGNNCNFIKMSNSGKFQVAYTSGNKIIFTSYNYGVSWTTFFLANNFDVLAMIGDGSVIYTCDWEGNIYYVKLPTYNNEINGNTAIVGNVFMINIPTFYSGINVLADASLNTRLIVASDVSMGGRLFLTGDANLTRRLIVASDVSSSGRLFVTGISTLTGDASLNTRLIVASDVSMGGRLFVTGISTLNGDVSMNNRLIVKGNVGVGTTIPIYPLHVSRGVAQATIASGYYWNNTNTNTALINAATTALTTPSVSIYASNYIQSATGFVASSDKRIKTNIKDINYTEALDMLRALRPKTYSFIDPISNGNKLAIGFIAQDIEKIIPNAVIKNASEFVPTIFEMVNVIEGRIIKLNQKSTSALQSDNNDEDVSGNDIRIKYIDSSNNDKITTIRTIIDDKTISVCDLIDSSMTFLYGQEVKDFRALDKDVIFTITTSAVQGIDNIVQTQQIKIQKLEAETIELTSRIAVLESRLSLAGF